MNSKTELVLLDFYRKIIHQYRLFYQTRMKIPKVRYLAFWKDTRKWH